MNIAFFIAAGVTIVATLLVITHHNAVHALLYLILSFISVAIIFYLIGAPFIAAIEVIIYAGAIMVFFLFVIMLLNPETLTTRQEAQLLSWRLWIGPGLLALILLGVLASVIFSEPMSDSHFAVVDVHEVGIGLFGPYLIAVQLGALLLLSGFIGASHIRRRHETAPQIRGGGEK